MQSLELVSLNTVVHLVSAVFTLLTVLSLRVVLLTTDRQCVDRP